MTGGVPTGALVLLHQGVIHQTWENTQRLIYICDNKDCNSCPNNIPATTQCFTEGASTSHDENSPVRQCVSILQMTLVMGCIIGGP